MKKDSLLKMKDLPATEEMLAVAREDVPVKVGSGWNTSYRCRYSGFARSSVEGGILKVTLYDPDAMRLGGTLPVYEIFMEKEKQQFLTYDRAHDKWRTAKIDYLEWQAKGSNNVWISAVDDAQIRQYLASDEKSVYRAKITFKAKGKISEYLRSPTECAYLAQKCGDGFVVRQFHVNRQYRKEENTITSKTSSFEKQRIFYRADLSSHPYHWGWYKQRRVRWVQGIDEYINTGMGYSYNEYCYQPGSIYGKTLSSIAPFLVRTGLREYVRLCRGCVSPNWYLFAWGWFPRVEQICKANLPRLTTECLEDFGAVKSCIRQESETSLVKALALDTHRLSRLRTLNGGTIMLDWLQREKCSGRIIPDHVLHWLEQEKIHVSDIDFILDRMSEQQVCNYLQRQKSGTRDSLRQIISTWRDYLSMADKLGINTHDEIVYRVKLLRQRHDELVEQLRKRERDMEAAATARKYRKIAGICRLIKPKYEYTGEVYSIVVPSGVRDIMREGDALSHCVGKSDRYWERIEQQEAYILFLRKTAEIDKPYYTLEVEPNGTIRQKRTYFDRQNEDLKDAEKFLKEWQKVVSERLTESDREKAEKSKVLRLQEFEQLRQDDIRIHTGDLAGQRLVDVLVSDLMETAA